MFKKLKDKLKGDEKPSYGTDQHNLQSNNPYYQHSQEQSTEKYQPPPGPPPNQASSSKPGYTAPPGPPPNRNTGSSSSAYTAPPGPPPSHQSSGYAPPPGPPPSYPQQPPPGWDPPPYHDWTVIPDTALLPPPPSMGYDSSPTANATAEEGDRALAWTKAHPLWPPQTLHPSTYTAIQNAQLALLKPPSLAGDLFPQQSAGHWRIRTYPSCRDSSILSNLPLYSALTDSPLITHHPRTLYFELKVTSIGHGASSSLSEADAGIAIGFVAPPYPTFRLPGWERASLGVHGDDGRKYVNDAWGGNDFTTAFKPGDTVGIGMTFEVPKNPPAYQGGQEGKVLDIKVFFTRNGVKEGEWDGNEELDVRSEGGNVGLRGECDLFAAIGVFGGVEFDVFFHPGQWLYRPV